MDDGHLRGSRDCDKFLISKLDADLVKEKEITEGYVSLVAEACADVDTALGRSVMAGNDTCGISLADGIRTMAKDSMESGRMRLVLGEIIHGVTAGQFSYCPDHGLMVRVDEDGCCISCGRDAMVYCRRAGE